MLAMKLLHVHRAIHNSIEWNWLRASTSFSCAAFRKLPSKQSLKKCFHPSLNVIMISAARLRTYLLRNHGKVALNVLFVLLIKEKGQEKEEREEKRKLKKISPNIIRNFYFPPGSWLREKKGQKNSLAQNYRNVIEILSGDVFFLPIQ